MAEEPNPRKWLSRLRRRQSTEYFAENPVWQARAKAHAKAQIDRLGEKFKLKRKLRKDRQDQATNNALVAELAAGAPAAVMIGSTFQRDAQGNRRIPILPEQLHVHFVKMQEGAELADATTGQRHPEFHIQVEYGSGASKRSWIVVRGLRALATLHLAYKAELGKQRVALVRHDSRLKLPEFPTSTFPYLRTLRATAWAKELQGGKEADLPTVREEEPRTPLSPLPEVYADDHQNVPSGRPSRTMRRLSTYSENLFSSTAKVSAAKKADFQKKQRQALEKWLQDLIKYLMFKPQINRLCRFLELSVPGMRLAPEGNFHGKEGALTMTRDNSRDIRKALSPEQLKQRFRPRWWSVRGSYLVCTNSAEDANIQDVIMIDSSFKVNLARPRTRVRDRSGKEMVVAVGRKTRHPQRHTIKVRNSERNIHLRASNGETARQFEDSMKTAVGSTVWARKNRYDSFAPVHSDVFVLPLVDGQELMWNLSRALSQAEDVIYLHGWWFSPEVFLRRPACISFYYRLDRLLLAKAEEGVKIFIIMYRNVESAIPIDSQYSKDSLQKLHPNIIVQRSPNQLRQNTFFWAHHEKICVIDHKICFVGGIDICFGRYDDPTHRLADDKPTGYEEEAAMLAKNVDTCQIWPGKDYSNPRVKDFYELNRPFDEEYDRTKVPRMPWHDMSMQLIGKPARDVSRHFVQRWNFIVRQRKLTRPTPILCPPPEFNQSDLDRLGLNGTCEVQVLRSAATWSSGLEQTEHSIMNAYVDAIHDSDHFVYIENQFFVTSTKFGVNNNHKILNGIGDALVERIIRAHENDECWRAIIMIPLLPGFEGQVHEKDATSLRLIVQCQYRSICRGESSIFGRLREAGIDPTKYIEIFSLRQWGILGPRRTLSTEQLYIHAKIMIVDDRIVICGSANINERSMLGDRDSEVGTIIRDKDMVSSTMNGQPYEVGLFPHTLRIRLMREHLGIDLEDLSEEEFFYDEGESRNTESDTAHSGDVAEETESRLKQERYPESSESEESSGEEDELDVSALYPSANGAPPKRQLDSLIGRSGSVRRVIEGTRSRSGSMRRMLDGSKVSVSVLEICETAPLPPYGYPLVRTNSFDLGLPMRSQLPSLPVTDDTDIGGPALHHSASVRKGVDLLGPKIAKMKRPQVSRDCMRDPLIESFYNGIWRAVAENNTLLYRTVFKCQPDNTVKNFEQYHKFNAAAEDFNENQDSDSYTGLSKELAEHLLTMIEGHLVTWPYDWLQKEESSWAAPIDIMAPLEIYD